MREFTIRHQRAPLDLNDDDIKFHAAVSGDADDERAARRIQAGLEQFKIRFPDFLTVNIAAR